MIAHIPVLLNEVIEYLEILESGMYIDATLGGGGYSKEIWEKLPAGSTLVSFDLDTDAIDNFKKQIGGEFEILDEKIIFKKLDGKILILVNENFAKLEDVYSRVEKLTSSLPVRGIVADLGLNSEQLDNKSGFSFQNLDQELDMRLDPNSGVKAIDLLMVGNTDQLAKLIEKYGDINGAWKLARTIKEKLKNGPEKFRVRELKLAIDEALGAHIAKKFELHAKVFQALRIAVNNEFENLEMLLKASEKLLAPNGRGVIVSFHSGEDRIVKFFIRDSANVKEVNKQIVTATFEEINQNKRSKSGKLRAFRKVASELLQ